MPLPLKPEENIYIDHKILDGTYSMPTMQAASDHYTIGYMVSGDRRWISTKAIRTSHAGDAGISKPHVYHRNCSMSDTPYDRYVIKVKTQIFQPIIDIIGEEELDFICSNYLHFTKDSQKINRHSPYLSITLHKCYPYYLFGISTFPSSVYHSIALRKFSITIV